MTPTCACSAEHALRLRVNFNTTNCLSALFILLPLQQRKFEELEAAQREKEALLEQIEREKCVRPTL